MRPQTCFSVIVSWPKCDCGFVLCSKDDRCCVLSAAYTLGNTNCNVDEKHSGDLVTNVTKRF
jgi:hypothetical protein